FTEIVTFKNGAAVRDIAAQIPLWKFMVETDCRYLAHVPFRGKRCEPAHTRIVAETIAAARGISLDDVAAMTTQTAQEFFRFNRCRLISRKVDRAVPCSMRKKVRLRRLT